MKDYKFPNCADINQVVIFIQDKESIEFGSPLERRSRSSCSISKNVHTPKNIIEKRMSDSDNFLSIQEKQAVGCSPGRRFVHKLLSPVVCGYPTPPGRHRYGVFNNSTHSLTSCDTISITSDIEDSPFLLFEFGTQELSDELALIDKELLIRISWEELSKCGWMAHEKFVSAPNVMKMVQFFNRVAMMVTTSILAEETPYRRAKVIRKAIKLACRCRALKNYNSLKAVLGGMQCTPIFRLKSSWKQVPSRYRRIFRELSELMSETNNFSSYQKEISLADQNPPYIPFLGNFLTTVAHTNAFMAVKTKYKGRKIIGSQTEYHASERNRSDNKENGFHNEIDQDVVDLNCSNEDLVDFKKDVILDPNKNHSRSDSDDSGVVLRRLSHNSVEDISPRGSCLSSPDEDVNRHIEDVFAKHNIKQGKLTPSQKRKYSSQDFVKNINTPDFKPFRKSYSVDNGSVHRKYFTDINNMINKRPIEPLVKDPLYDCHIRFWKFQISAVQLNIIPRPYIRRFLINSPFSTEEENYKLSLQREPPSQALS